MKTDNSPEQDDDCSFSKRAQIQKLNNCAVRSFLTFTQRVYVAVCQKEATRVEGEFGLFLRVLATRAAEAQAAPRKPCGATLGSARPTPGAHLGGFPPPRGQEVTLGVLGMKPSRKFGGSSCGGCSGPRGPVEGGRVSGAGVRVTPLLSDRSSGASTDVVWGCFTGSGRSAQTDQPCERYWGWESDNRRVRQNSVSSFGAGCLSLSIC